VRAFREAGYPPEALLNHLALLGWSPPGGADLLTREELLAGFDLGRVSHAPAVFDPKKLDALSMRHIARMPKERLTPEAIHHLAAAGLLLEPLPPVVAAWVERLAQLYAERLACFSDLPKETDLVFGFSAERSLADEDVRSTLGDPRARQVIEETLRELAADPLDAPRFQALSAEVRRRTGAKGKDLFHPMRVGLTGWPSGPELVRLLPLLDEGSRLPLPRPVASCATRAGALLAATAERGA
jgi:nondiscriminating glutamyl-tRNA synthetase